jgi:hypothetical protein
MHRRPGTWLAGLIIASVLLPAGAVQADLSEDLLIGLNLLGYRTGFQKNYLGKGWDFDATAYYSGQTYRFGWADLTLGEGQNVPVQISAGYTLRGLPSARFSMTTGTNTTPLNYTMIANYGVQDLTAVGSALINIDTTINALGFYDMTFHISNRGTFQTEGFAGQDQGTLDFDAGPIVVSGNIFADILAAITQPLFNAAGTENPFAKFSHKSVRGLNSDLDLANLSADGSLTGDQVGQVVNNLLASAILGQDSIADPWANLNMTSNLLLTDGSQMETLIGTQSVPEPATLGMLAIALAACRLRRRRA